MWATLAQVLMTIALTFGPAAFFAVLGRNALLRGEISTKNGTYNKHRNPFSYWYSTVLCLACAPMFSGLGIWGVIHIVSR